MRGKLVSSEGGKLVSSEWESWLLVGESWLVVGKKLVSSGAEAG